LLWHSIRVIGLNGEQPERYLKSERVFESSRFILNWRIEFDFDEPAVRRGKPGTKNKRSIGWSNEDYNL